MAIFSPKQKELTQMLLDTGQTIVVRSVTRTVDDDGLVTAISTSNTSISALVDEIDDKRKDLLEGGYYSVGDVRFHIDPDDVVNVFDKIVWNNIIYTVKKLNYPQKIAGYYPYMEVHGIRDTSE